MLSPRATPHGFFGEAQAAFGRLEERSPSFGQMYRPRGAHEQLHPHLVFQLLDSLAEGGRREADCARGLAKVEKARRAFETLEAVE